MNTQKWRKRRELLLGQLHNLEMRRTTHWDERTGGSLSRDTTEESIARLKGRLAELDAKFTDESDA